MGTEAFLRGRYTPQEGGPKGIDTDSEMNVLVAAFEHSANGFLRLARSAELVTFRIDRHCPTDRAIGFLVERLDCLT